MDEFLSVKIRPAREGDIAVLAAMIAEMPLWQRYGVDRARAERLLRGAMERAELVLVAEAEDVPVGVVWALVQGAFGISGYIRLLAVRPGWQRKGVGSQLIAAAEREIARMASSVFLLTSEFNVDAQRFYERLGYQRVGAIPDYVIQGVAELIYYKPLWSQGCS